MSIGVIACLGPWRHAHAKLLRFCWLHARSAGYSSACCATAAVFEVYGGQRDSGGADRGFRPRLWERQKNEVSYARKLERSSDRKASYFWWAEEMHFGSLSRPFTSPVGLGFGGFQSQTYFP